MIMGTFQAAATFNDPIITPFRPKKCFVVMQFDTHRDFVYDYVIAPVLKDHKVFDFQIERANKLLTAGRITDEIETRLRNADLIIADISENNPNVFYELDFTHASHQTAILLKEKVEGKLEIPFDIGSLRVHVYDFSPIGFKELQEKLPEIITNELAKHDREQEKPS